MEDDSKIANISTLVRMFPLHQLAVNELGKKLWGNFILRESLNDDISDIDVENIVPHREKLTNTIFQENFFGLPVTLRDLLIEALVWFQQGFSEVLSWEFRCENGLPFTTLNPVTAGPYWAGNFINPAGQFDELTWAKCFIADETQPMLCRFQFACFYCFEDIIKNLWYTIKASSELHDSFKRATRYTYELVTWWTLWLEKPEYNYFDISYVSGLHNTFITHHEYAARFFWENCSLSERSKYLTEFNCSKLVDAAVSDQSRFIQFIYSLFPKNKKKTLIAFTVQERESKDIWYCLFQSPFYKIVLDDIFTFPDPIPAKFYGRLFSTIIDLIENLKIPVHKEIFKALWHNLSPDQKEVVFNSSSHMTHRLADIDAIDLIIMIVESLPHHLKLKVLLPTQLFSLSGLAPFKKFSEMRDYDSLYHYLLIFLMDRDPNTLKCTLRTDAPNTLASLLTNKLFLLFLKLQFDESQEKEIIQFMEALNASLEVVANLLHQTHVQCFQEKNRASSLSTQDLKPSQILH